MLNEAPGIRCPVPEGAFYVYPDINDCIGKTSASRHQDRNDEDSPMPCWRKPASPWCSARPSACRRLPHQLCHLGRTAAEACTRIQWFDTIFHGLPVADGAIKG
jgi:hypothetical protein